MNTATAASARRALYRGFHDLTPLFEAYATRHVVRRSARCTSVCVKRSISSTACRRLKVETAPHIDNGGPPLLKPAKSAQRQLPPACPGCGALTQSIHPREAGFYTPKRSAVKEYLTSSIETFEKDAAAEKEILQKALANLSLEMKAQLGFDLSGPTRKDVEASQEIEIPVCDRCHHLVHHHQGTPISHPSLDAISATIAESPHKYNHVYHVMDAADFPMSFIPGLTKKLDFAWIRSRNRRAKTQHWSGGKSGQISFIITRADLLAPKKEQVDQLMPQLREILRDAIGRTGRDVRLGNVHLLSSKRGWWTKQVKADIWERGGANWLVGKANVGKSNVFQQLYPKGTNEATPDFQDVREEARRADVQATLAATTQLPSDMDAGTSAFEPTKVHDHETIMHDDILPTNLLLPPPQQEVKYPVMPIISDLPGTTASPIRIPFGKGRGELIDLPGMVRNTLEPYVRPENQLDIVMKQRIVPDRIVIKPGSSLVLGGGLIRITPKTPDLIFMVHAFVPMSAHLTSTQKAIELQAGERDIDIESIMRDEAKGKVKHAGTFKLESNVTKKFAGPLTRRSDVGLATARLPFVVWATDILIEGCGWVEIVAQTRKPRPTASGWYQDAIDDKPVVRVDDQVNDAIWSPMFEDAGTIDTSDGNPSPWTLNQATPRNEDDPTSNKYKKKSQKQDKARHPLDLPPQVLAKTMPEIEVYSPEGRFVGQRPSLSCWLLGGPLERKTAGRPRKSMKGDKKMRKRAAKRETDE